MGKKIVTVLGEIEPEALGVTLPHDHLLIDLYPIIPDYAATLDDEQQAIEELTAFKDAGGNSLVDTTSVGVGRDPLALRRISQAVGLHIVMGSGWYREAVYPRDVLEKNVNELAQLIVRDLTEGADGTGIRAGVIGEIGTERHQITPAQERVFRAAARAHKQTGAAITTHTTHLGELAREQLQLLTDEEGVDPARIIIGHMGDRREVTWELDVVRAGAYVEFDHIGFPQFQSDAQRARNVARLIELGYVERILLSLDICMTSHLHCYGGKGYDYLLKSFVPCLKAEGVDDKDIRTMLVENPRRVLAF